MENIEWKNKVSNHWTNKKMYNWRAYEMLNYLEYLIKYGKLSNEILETIANYQQWIKEEVDD